MTQATETVSEDMGIVDASCATQGNNINIAYPSDVEVLRGFVVGSSGELSFAISSGSWCADGPQR